MTKIQTKVTKHSTMVWFLNNEGAAVVATVEQDSQAWHSTKTTWHVNFEGRKMFEGSNKTDATKYAKEFLRKKLK